MNITKQMVDDMFNVITAILDAVATVPPGAPSLTKKEVVVDVLAKTCGSLKDDIERYFISSTENNDINYKSRMSQEEAVAKAQAIVTATSNSNFASEFEEIWSIAGPILALIKDTAKSSLPDKSTALDAMITAIDAISAFGNELNLDLPKMKNS